MKIQELAIIFILIILPISLVLSEYMQFQIQTINLQTEYDTKLTAATYDAIKAFQLNSTNSTTSDLANSKLRDIEASVNSFRNSIMSGFELNGYTEEALDNYIPALVYTLYDGFYIYSPYKNTNYRYKDAITGEIVTKTNSSNSDTAIDENGEMLYGLKPYISYSCRYKTSSIDVIITYALDNHITVQGIINGEYVNKNGYLIDNIDVTGETVIYNGVEIQTEQLKENVGDSVYNYAKINGIKYYLVGNKIVYILNGTPVVQFDENDEQFIAWRDFILNNDSAKRYYKEAKEFTDWFKSSDLINLTYANAIDEVIANDGSTSITNIWAGDSTRIFEFNNTLDSSKNIENELSNYNQHRLAVIRHKIETNLAIAISNYNEYSGATNIFQMPELKEDEWEHITHNISLISFLQGLPIGGKIYNGYSLVTNSESKEVVLEESIYILGYDNSNGKYNYHKIGDKGFETGGTVSVNASAYGSEISAGRLNLDFEKTVLKNSDNTTSYYYYPLQSYNASYDSVVMQNNVTTYDDIYEYINGQSDAVKKAFYIALGRERASKYNSKSTLDFNILQEEKYEVIFHGNADGVTNLPVIQTKTEGVDLELSNDIPKKSGYTFKGWSTSPNGVVVYPKGQNNIYDADTNLNLYAVWEVLENCTITYIYRGAEGFTQTQTVVKGQTITLPSTITYSNKTYQIWNIRDASDASTIYPPGRTITIDSDMTLVIIGSILAN